MEVHRPRPWHGWRELAKEVGVIVIGIAIALLGEQTISWLHRRAEVDEARHALRSEIAQDAAAAQANIEKERCLGAFLTRIAAWASGGPPPPRLNFHPFYMLGTSNWEVVKAGTAAHMPLEERLAYSRFYDAAEYANLDLRTEIPLWLRLGSDSAKVTPTQADAQVIRQDTVPLRVMAAVRTGASLGIVQSAKAMGVEAAAFSAEQRANLADSCGPVGIVPHLS